MKKIIDFIQPFNEFELEVNEFNFKNNNSEDFWDFIKKQNRKGVYIFIDSSKRGIKKIIYIGKAGKIEDNKTTIKKRTQSHYFLGRGTYRKGKNKGKRKNPNSPLNIDGMFEFKKLNSSVPKQDRILKKDNFVMITIQILEDNSVSPELLESFLLNKLLKEYKHYPIFNNKI